MSRTIRKEYTSRLFHNGEHGHHNSLSREFKGVDEGGYAIKGIRGLIDRRDYESDRNKGIRRMLGKKRRNALKRNSKIMIEEELSVQYI